MSFNKNQIKVINSDKKNILVSASAGSGKTTVMMERVINLIDKTSTPLKNFVIVTFTKDAAADMKKKLREKLIDKLMNNEVENEDFLRQELFRIESANISTLHSFCQTIIRSYFEKAGVSPVFSVIDDIESIALKNDCLNDVFNIHYDSDDSVFMSLLSAISNRAKDDDLKKIILSIYEFLKINEKPIDEVITSYLNEYDDTSKSKRFLHEYIKTNNSVLLDDLKVYESALKDEEKVYSFIQEIKSSLEDRDSLDLAINALNNNLTTTSLPRKIDDMKKAAYDSFRQSYWPAYKKYRDQLKQNIYKSIPEFDSDAKKAKKNLEKIFEIVKEFDDKYSLKKQDLQVLDFNDLEKKTLEVLLDNDTLKILKDTYKYIFVDEYQDINYLQETILSKLARNNNLLMVGDAKQSIYGFRQCKPEIFLSKRNRFIDQIEQESEAIELNENYRSKEEILEFVNEIFKKVMKEDFSGINYQKDSILKAGLEEQKIKEDSSVVINLIKTNEDEKSNKKDLEELEFKLIEHHINELTKKSFYDIKKGEERKFEENDICILARKRRHLENIYLYFLNKGVQLDIKYEKGIEEIPEISVLYSLVKSISNPKDDISFIATLRNIYGLSDSDLLIIANENKADKFKSSFFDKVKTCTNKQLQPRLDFVISNLNEYRFLAQSKETSDILYAICLENGYFNRLLQMEDGFNKKNRVEEYILSLKGKDIVSNIYKFAGSIDDNNISLSILGSGNGIKLRTIHACKGLEYPAVILSDAGRSFRGQGDSIDVDRDLGVGYNYYNHDKKVYSETIVRKAIQRKKYMQEQEEELRLLYVALTRAKNKLIIIGKDAASTDGLSFPLRVASNYMTWIKLGLNKAQVDYYQEDDNFAFIKQEVKGEFNEGLYNKLKAQLEFEYKYQEDTNKLRKTSVVSYNVHNIDDLEYIESPYEIKEGKIDRGNAYHKFMEYVDYNRPIKIQLNELRNSNVFSEEEFKYLDEEKLNRLLSLPVFDEIKKSHYYREHPFMMLNKDGQMIQGIIDMFFIKDGKAYLVDYKYSSLSDKSLKEVYTPQLMLYKKALEDILKLKVEKVMLLNLNSESLVEL